MLQDMEHPGVVLGDGAEGNGKGLVFLFPLQPDQIRAVFLIGHTVQGGLQFRQRLVVLPDKTVKMMVCIHKRSSKLT